MTLPAPLAAAIAEQPPGATWARLFSQRNAAYDAELWESLRLLHEGGFEIQENAKLFCPRVPEEPKKEYEWRLKTTAYVNHMARVVGHLVGGLFGVPLKVAAEGKTGSSAPATPDEPFYKAFANDCDLQGTNFSQFMRARLIGALVQKRALIGVDMPRGVPDAANKLQEEQLGVGRAWLYSIPLESMLDWECDDKGRFVWCKLIKKIVDRSDPLGDHSSYKYQFKIWRMLDTGAAAFEVYETKSVTKDEDIKPDEIVSRVTERTPTTFSRIPIVEINLPAAIWAGNQLGPLCKEHYNGRSNLRGSMCRSLVEIPFVKLGSEIPSVNGALPADVQQNPGRGVDPVGQARAKGFLVLGAGDDFSFKGPSGNAWTIASSENFKVREEIYSALNTMSLALSNTGATVQRSGESKAEDRSATGVILDFLADSTREVSEMVYDVVSDGRGDNERGGKIVWKATGVDSYDDDDRAALIGEATEFLTLDIPSKTARKVYLKSLVARMNPKSSDAEKQEMFDELDQHVTDEMVMPPKPLLGLGAPGAGGANPKLPPGAGKTNLPPKPPIPGK